MLLVLGSSRGRAKWVRLLIPPNRTPRAERFCWNCSPTSCRSSGWFPGFFFRQTKFWLAGQVSHFGSGLFDRLDKLWREFEVVGAFKPCNRTNRTKTDSVLGTMWSPSYRIKCYSLNIILSSARQIWRADNNKLSAQTSQAR